MQDTFRRRRALLIFDNAENASILAFDTDRVTVFQIRSQHTNEEVRELVPADYAGVMVTDRGPSYEAEELSGSSNRNAWTISIAISTKRWKPRPDGPAALD